VTRHDAEWPEVTKPGRTTVIQAVPMWYADTRFRSTLEADWACTFDFLGWHWEYEPGAVQIGNVTYLPDFRLPGQGVWAEVKGPGNERIAKPRRLHTAVSVAWEKSPELVVLCRPAVRGLAAWECATGSHDITIVRCGACNQWCFNKPQRSRFGTVGQDWRCRHCRAARLIPEVAYLPAGRVAEIEREFGEYDHRVDWLREWYGDFGRLPFQRAPRGRTPAASRQAKPRTA
jgi:hypothetical protein